MIWKGNYMNKTLKDIKKNDNIELLKNELYD